MKRILRTGTSTIRSEYWYTTTIAKVRSVGGLQKSGQFKGCKLKSVNKQSIINFQNNICMFSSEGARLCRFSLQETCTKE